MDPNGCLLKGKGDDIQHVCYSKQKLQKDEIIKGLAYLLVSTPSVHQGHATENQHKQEPNKILSLKKIEEKKNPNFLTVDV